MIKRVALLLAVALFVAADVEAGRFSRGGCANGQCGRPAYYQPDAKVAVQTAKQGVVQASATEPIAAVDATVEAQSQPVVVTQTSRRRGFRRGLR
jgi:hypothetical protein